MGCRCDEEEKTCQSMMIIHDSLTEDDAGVDDRGRFSCLLFLPTHVVML
jgi:hypothetical protein